MNQPAQQRGLDSLLSLDESEADWTDKDLAAMLHHQLAAPLDDGTGPAGMTILALLQDRGAPADAFQSLKRRAKVRRAEPPAGVPADLWRVLYFASIAAATAAGHRISDLSPADLDAGFRWTLARPWLDPSIRTLIHVVRGGNAL